MNKNGLRVVLAVFILSSCALAHAAVSQETETLQQLETLKMLERLKKNREIPQVERLIPAPQKIMTVAVAKKYGVVKTFPVSPSIPKVIPKKDSDKDTKLEKKLPKETVVPKKDSGKDAKLEKKLPIKTMVGDLGDKKQDLGASSQKVSQPDAAPAASQPSKPAKKGFGGFFN